MAGYDSPLGTRRGPGIRAFLVAAAVLSTATATSIAGSITGPVAGAGTDGASEQVATAGPNVVRFDRAGFYRYRVPVGVTRLTFTVNGAQGGKSGGVGGGPAGGRGGSTVVTMDVTPGDPFLVVVGGKGADGPPNSSQPRNGGYNGGADGGRSSRNSGGGGGGASDVRRGGDGVANRFIVAGGGGGSGGIHSLPNDPNLTAGGAGSGGGGAGLGGNPDWDKVIVGGGGGGSATVGGGGGRLQFYGQQNSEGANGALFNGGKGGEYGSGGLGFEQGGSGGGGGGGMYGGGGGAGAPLYSRVYPGGGGGGGGGFAAAGLAAQFVQDVQEGNGLVTITENPGTAPTLTCPPAPLATVGQDSYRLRCDMDGLPIPHEFTTTDGAPPPKPTFDSSDFALDLDWSEDGGNPLNKAGTYTFTLSASNGVLPGAQVPVSITVSPRQTETTIKSSAPTSEFGDVVTFTAPIPAPTGVAVTGDVEFFDGDAFLGTAHVGADNKATFDAANLAGGAHEIRASYRGDANNLPSLSEPITQQVDPVASETKITASENPTVTGQPVAYRVRVDVTGRDRLSADGQVQLVVNGEPSGEPIPLEHGEAVSAPIADLPVGDHKVVARYLGSPNFDPSQGTLDPDQRVNKAQTTVQLESAPNPSYETQPIEFRATVTPNPPGGGTPNGQIELREGDTRVGQPANLDGGRATIPVTNLKDGLHRIVAVYAGSDRFSGDTSSPPIEQRVRDLRSIVVTPAAVTLRRGETLQLVATGRFADGSTQDVTAVVNWTSANPKAAAISDRGVLTIPANAPAHLGVRITAKLFGRTDRSTITVRGAAAESVVTTTTRPIPLPGPAPTQAPAPTSAPPTTTAPTADED